MDLYKIKKEEVIKILNSSIDGLSLKDVKSKQKKHGLNELLLKKRKSKAIVFLSQFNDVLVIILIISAIISVFTDSIASAIVILIVLVINALIGTIQYFKAEKTLESLRSLSSPTVKVQRDGKIEVIESKYLTVGDIVLISSGDVLCSDGRLIESDGLEVNESAITGESNNIEKDANTYYDKEVPIAEQKNMVFSSSQVVKGKGKYIVSSIGMDSQIGKIAQMVSKDEKRKSPLQKSLDEFSKYLAMLIIFICVVVFCINIYKHISFIDSLMFSVSLAVAAIPEALSAIVTIVLAIGTRELAVNKAVMKDIKSVETLGAVSHIFSDKTGTITTGEVKLHSLYNYLDNGIDININEEFENAMIYCNSIEDDSTSDPIERCIHSYFQDKKIDITERKNNKNIHTISFDSNRKMMSVSFEYMLYVKGAPEKILSLCNYYKFNNHKNELNSIIRKELEQKLLEMTSSGFRVIAYACKGVYKETHSSFDENNLTFLGFVLFYDPPRENVEEAIKLCKKAKITPIMITGDNINTAKYIARKIGLYEDGDLALTGNELENMSDDELLTNIEKVKIYARSTPEDKIRIVSLMQEKNKIVAMTGDGVNDAPALKKANVGISMGKKGTEVAKDASSVILTDDNFYTIIKAIGIGRKIYANIQNAIRFLIAGNGAGILIVLITSIFALPMPFAPVHLLFINLLTDSLPAIAIGLEKSNEDYMDQKPRNINSKILSKKVFIKTSIEAILIGGVVLAGYFIGLEINQYYAQTNSFLVLSMSRLFYSLSCRRDKSIFKQKNNNVMLNLSISIGIVLLILVTFVPFLKNVFFVSDLSIIDFLIIAGLSLIPTVLIQCRYLFKK